MNNARVSACGLLFVAAVLAWLPLTVWASPIAPPMPSSSWLLDQGSGTTFWPWTGPGSGTMGSNSGSATPQWSSDVPLAYPGNNSLSFTGTGMNVPSNWATVTGVPSGTVGSLSLWVYDNDGLSPHYVMDASSGARTLMYRTSGISTYLNNTSIGTPAGNLIPVGEWTHVALVWDSADPVAKQKIYKNGALFQTFNVSVSAVSPAEVFLGSRMSKTEGWSGKIDEYAHWDVALSADHVAWLAQNSVRSLGSGPG